MNRHFPSDHLLATEEQQIRWETDLSSDAIPVNYRIDPDGIAAGLPLVSDVGLVEVTVLVMNKADRPVTVGASHHLHIESGLLLLHKELGGEVSDGHIGRNRRFWRNDTLRS
jgi:hypothetical protein